MHKRVLIAWVGAIMLILLFVVLVIRVMDTPTSSDLKSMRSTTTTPQVKAKSRKTYCTSLRVDLLTSDGIPLKACYYPPKNSRVETSTLLLLHAAFEDRRSWNYFKEEAREGGYSVFMVDLRGHGQSGGEKIFDQLMDHDADAALTWLQGSPKVKSENIAIVGESLGANLALRAAAKHPEIKAVVLLSPGMNLWEIDITEAIVNYGSRPILLVAAEGDGYPADTVKMLDEQALGSHKLQIYPGAEHGTKMIDAHPDLSLLILNWLEEEIP